MSDYEKNGFEIVDRYDIVITLLLGLGMVGALALGAPLWAVPVVMFITSVVVFIRHFDETMGPVEPSTGGRESRLERITTPLGK